MLKLVNGRGGEISALGFFAVLLLATVVVPFVDPSIATGRGAALWNAALSIGTSGASAFLFYYLVSERLVQRNRSLLRESARDSFVDAKRNIAFAVIHASQKGGRRDLIATQSTVESMLSLDGFRALFEGGRQANEGYYAFQNEMSERTPEFDEIVFNLKAIGRAATRLVDGGGVLDRTNYSMLVRLSTVVERIELNGAGYDESKLLCGFIWEMFTGWSNIEGYRDRDVIGGAFEAAR